MFPVRSIKTEVVAQKPAEVLYVDHQGHPAPLSVCYHATASRRLASAVERHPPSTVTEIDSAFCPQCLSFYDAATAASLGFCPKASCRNCPMCNSVASIGVDGTDCLYKCGSCDWNSRKCFLSQPITVAKDGSVTKEDLDQSAEELAQDWTERRLQRNQSSDEHYKAMLSTLEGMVKEQVKGQRSVFSWLPTANVRRRDGPEGWSVEALEQSLADRKKLVSASLAETVGDQELQFVSLEVDQPLSESLQGRSVDSLLLQGGGAQITKEEELLPLPIPLRPRKSRRCRAELADGRPGILVKPKLNPLEGDSSLRTGHGQWWKKDSSAIQVLPRVRVRSHESDESKHAFLLKVSNPTLGTIRLRFASSDYSGEPVWDDSSSTTSLLQNILLNPFTDSRVDAKLLPELVAGMEPTDFCQLDASEDSFLDLGKTSNEIPPAVIDWKPSTALSESEVKTDGPPSALRFVGSANSNAWFELVVLEKAVPEGHNHAVPLAMQIEVGSGSWDSSLILPNIKDEGDDSKDAVTFSLVIVWE